MQAVRGDGVAGDDQRLDPVRREVARREQRVARDDLAGARAIRNARGVAQVDRVLVGSRAISVRNTVRPPTPLSNTPIGASARLLTRAGNYHGSASTVTSTAVVKGAEKSVVTGWCV